MKFVFNKCETELSVVGPVDCHDADQDEFATACAKLNSGFIEKFNIFRVCQVGVSDHYANLKCRLLSLPQILFDYEIFSTSQNLVLSRRGYEGFNIFDSNSYVHSNYVGK